MVDYSHPRPRTAKRKVRRGILVKMPKPHLRTYASRIERIFVTSLREIYKRHVIGVESGTHVGGRNAVVSANAWQLCTFVILVKPAVTCRVGKVTHLHSRLIPRRAAFCSNLDP